MTITVVVVITAPRSRSVVGSGRCRRSGQWASVLMRWAVDEHPNGPMLGGPSFNETERSDSAQSADEPVESRSVRHFFERKGSALGRRRVFLFEINLKSVWCRGTMGGDGWRWSVGAERESERESELT